MNNFSPNMLKTFDECTQKFFFKYIQKLSLPQRTSSFEKGKKIHALANYYLRKNDIKKMEKSLTPDEKTTWQTLKSSKYFNLKVINTEYNLSCRIKQYWIGGRLDAFMADDEDYFILDYKTGDVPSDAQQNFQTIVYLLCADKYLNQKGGYKSLKFIYLGLKKNTEVEILLNNDLKKKYEEKINSICTQIDSTLNSAVFTKHKERCETCEYNKLCK